MKSILVFVYNADGGLFNALTDAAHKIFSPQTYPCRLCALTHSNFRVRAEWKEFIASLDRRVEFLHADEFKARYGVEGLRLPAVFRKSGEKLESFLDAESINACRSVDDLKRAVTNNLSQ